MAYSENFYTYSDIKPVGNVFQIVDNYGSEKMIQEFWTYKSAQEYIHYLNELIEIDKKRAARMHRFTITVFKAYTMKDDETKTLDYLLGADDKSISEICDAWEDNGYKVIETKYNGVK